MSDMFYSVTIQTTTITEKTYNVITSSQEEAEEKALNVHKYATQPSYEVRTQTFKIISNNTPPKAIHYADSQSEAFAFSRGVLYTNPNLYPRITEKNGRWEIRFVENEEED